MQKIGLCLSGCGVQDGSEIHETVLTLLALDRKKVEIIFIAPDIEQLKTINHATGEELKEKRNVLIESARISRGNIKNIKDIKAEDIDALILPGGFGAALNLCNFGIAGENCVVNEDVKNLVLKMNEAKKPIGAMCIAPAMIAKILRGKKVKLTIGTDVDTAKKIVNMGAEHVNCQANEIVIDEQNKIVSTPAYMLGKSISEIAEGIEKLVAKVIQLIS